MADFSAVLKKAIDGLPENTPEAREKVYQKARATIEAKLAALTPPPAEAVAERQRQLLEKAIADAESAYAETPAPPPADDLDSVFAELDPHTVAPADSGPGEEAPPAAAAGDARDDLGEGVAATAPESVDAVRAGDDVAAGAADRESPETPEPTGPEMADAPPQDAVPQAAARGRRRGGGSVLAGLLVLLVLVAGAAGAWIYRDDLARIANVGEGAGPVATEDAGADGAGAESGQDGEAGTEMAAAPEPQANDAEGDVADGAGGTQTAPARTEKFTQRLTADGEEIDAGPAEGEPGLGEGTSVAQASAPESDAPNGAGTAPEGAGQTPAAEGNGADQALAVGQQAIFYEERTNVSQGSAEAGSVVWSTVQESPGNDLPPEPAIRAEANIPAKNLQLKMTIRRNADDSLPASHVVEIIFLTPDDFEGGGIDNVLRIALKSSEQDTGSPLLGIPAKIADGFFLVALNDSRADIETNRLLMRRQNWIDIPVVYQSGRRALITLEKGIPGERIFNEALTAWQNASSG